MKAIRTTLILAALSSVAFQAHAAKLKVPGDYPTIQDAIDAAGAGDTVVIKAGTYDEDFDVLNKTELTIKGNGKVVIRGDGAGVPASVVTSSDIRLKNLRIEDAASNGLLITNSEDCEVIKCRVEGVGLVGILVINTPGCHIRNCQVKNVGGRGIRVNESTGAVLSANKVTGTGGEGISVDGSFHTVEDNVIKDAGTYGIRVATDSDGAASCLVVDNEISMSGNDGILVNAGAESCSLFGNEVKDAQDDGIHLMQNSSGHSLDRNKVSGSVSDGININADASVLSRNKMKQSGGRGLLVGILSDDSLFFKNSSKQAALDGFRISGSPHSFIENTSKQSGGLDLNDTSAPGVNTYVDNDFGTTN